MKNRLRYLALLMVLAVLTTACAGAESEPATTEPAEAVTEATSEAAVEASVEEVKEEPVEAVEWEEPENVVDPQFTDDFDEVTDYSACLEGSSVKSGSRIWIMGKVEEYDKEAKAIKVATKDGPWIVSVGAAGTDDYYKLVEKTVDQYVRIFGVYTGYEADYGMPSMAFQPKDYQKYAFRLESVDNNFRLTQTDYTVPMPEFDTDETFMNISYKIASAWTKDDSESAHYYKYPEDTLSSFIMYNYIENAKMGFDEINADQVLSDLADSYVDDGDEVLRKQSFKLGGYPALCFEMAFTPDGYPIPLTMFCYMFIVEDQYYFYGATEPYLVGETSKQFLSNMFKELKLADDDSTADKTTGANDSAAEASTKDSATEETTKDASKDASKDTSSKSDNASAENTTAAADTSKTETAQAEAAKPAYPPKSEIEGKTFTQHMKGTLTGENNGEMLTLDMEDDLPAILITSDIVANYDEATGKSSCVMDIEGVPTPMTFSFSYNSKGTIVYSAPFSYTTPQYTATGVMSGYRK